MSNPLRAPTSIINNDALVPSAFFGRDPKSCNLKLELDAVVSYYVDRGYPMRNSVLIPESDTVEPESLKDGLATAQQGGLQFTRRSGSAYAVNSQMWRTLHDSAGPFSKQEVGAVMRDKFMVAASTQLCRGRFAKYYEKNFRRLNLLPPTAAEVAASLKDSGCVITGAPPAPYRVTPDPDFPEELAIKVNLNSDNGYPVGGKGNTEGALERVLLLSTECRRRLDKVAAGGIGPVHRAELVEAEIYSWHERHPSLVLTKGKCKMDYYSEEKIATSMMRFYNALPKQLVFIMQQATQPYEHQTQGLFEHPEIHSAQKITLVRGGADRLVDIMDKQLLKDGAAYVHVGDDSWVAIREPDGQLVLTALDCSSFDLTQHKDITLPIHQGFRDQLALIDPVSAGVWMAFMRKRLTVVEKTVVVLMEHGGPSGTPMQSKVNDVAMDILIKRFLVAYVPGSTEAQTNAVMATVGSALGFTVKVEQFQRLRVRTLREALRQTKFQFIGYHFYTHPSGYVYPFIDLPRTMAQMAYPSGKWQADKDHFREIEAMRLTSIAMGSGIAPPNQRVQDALFQEATILLVKALGRSRSPDREDDRLLWSTQTAQHAMGSEDVRQFAASLRGLFHAFDEGRGVLALWRHPEHSEDVSNPSKVRRVYTAETLLKMRPVRSPPSSVTLTGDELPNTSVLVRVVPLPSDFEAEIPVTPVIPGYRAREILEDTFEELEAPSKPLRKTLGRTPRLKRETRAQQSARVHAANVERAESLRRMATEAYSDVDATDIQGKRNQRKRVNKARSTMGSQAAARSMGDAAESSKDLRRGKGSGQKGGRHRKK